MNNSSLVSYYKFELGNFSQGTAAYKMLHYCTDGIMHFLNIIFRKKRKNTKCIEHYKKRRLLCQDSIKQVQWDKVR